MQCSAASSSSSSSSSSDSDATSQARSSTTLVESDDDNMPGQNVQVKVHLMEGDFTYVQVDLEVLFPCNHLPQLIELQQNLPAGSVTAFPVNHIQIEGARTYVAMTGRPRPDQALVL